MRDVNVPFRARFYRRRRRPYFLLSSDINSTQLGSLMMSGPPSAALIMSKVLTNLSDKYGGC